MANIYNKKLNLLAAYEEKIRLGNKEKNKGKSFRNLLIAVSAAMLIVLGGVYFFVDNLYNAKMDELSEARDMLLDPYLSEKSAEASMYESKTALLKERYDAIQLAISCAGELPEYGYYKENFLEKLSELCGDNTSVKSVSVSDKNVELQLAVYSVEQASEFVMRLENSGMFASVVYGGFTNSEEETEDADEEETSDIKPVEFSLHCEFSEVNE